jgi:hypothetical protein
MQEKILIRKLKEPFRLFLFGIVAESTGGLTDKPGSTSATR